MARPAASHFSRKLNAARNQFQFPITIFLHLQYGRENPLHRRRLSSRSGMRNATSAHRPERGRWEVGTSGSGIRGTVYTHPSPDQRHCVLACDPIPSLTSPSLRHLDWGFLVRILRRVGFGKLKTLKTKLRLLEPQASRSLLGSLASWCSRLGG